VSGVFEFEAEEEAEGFDGVVAAVDEVSEEDVGCVGGVAADLGCEEVEEVVELSVYVSYYRNGANDWLHIILFH